MEATRRVQITYYVLVAIGALLLLGGLGAAHLMEEHGHAITGMSNQIVWGTPHVFAIFLIVAASGVLNVASVGSVFGKAEYKPHAPLSGLLSVAALAGGLMVLMLDLGRPDRLIVAATHFNFTSVFAWNVFLYSGMFTAVALYLWTMMERRMNRYSKAAGVLAFVWRFVLTTGTGSIFGFLVARQAYQSAVLAPLFIAMSLAWGMALFLLAQAGLYAWQRRALPAQMQARMAGLLAVLVGALAYFVLVYHLTNLYFARQAAFERFILVDGGIYPLLFWAGFVLLGTVLPLFLLLAPRAWPGWLAQRSALLASALVVLGAFALLYVFIIGGQAFPLDIFPGYVVTGSSFFDGAVDPYTPSAPEVLLGLGGVGAAFLLTVIAVRVLRFLPAESTDPGALQPAQH